MKDIHFIAERIKQLCDKQGISINKMLTESGAGARTYHNMMAGSYPSMDKIVKIAQYFNVSVDYLLGNEEKPTNEGELSEKKRLFIQKVEGMTDSQLERLEQILALVDNTTE